MSVDIITEEDDGNWTTTNATDQLIDEKKKERRPFVCGVVEGFYGRPWTTEQRRHLFGRLRALDMNTYLYAPKDDLKHRVEWRQLYTPEETDHLRGLIQGANEHCITFCYALSPGIDIVYSSQADVNAVKHKFEQVKNLGCQSFALLFDDIETVMNELDRSTFSSFALAQISVANDVFEYLNCLQFLFCPTEYCETRAVPNLNESDYLNTLGCKLLPDIEIMWTGPRVVSRELSIEHVRRVSRVLGRKPIIWDNLHANDYDPKRVYLGPYAGRSVVLRDELRGILANPNCEYEANFVLLHTLAHWNRCEGDANIANDSDCDAKLNSVADQSIRIHSAKLYHPLKSFADALDEWTCHFSSTPPSISSKQLLAWTATTSENSTLLPSSPIIHQTCEGNELASVVETPVTYTAPMSDCRLITVQSHVVEPSLINISTTTLGIVSTAVNSFTDEYSSEPMETMLNTVKDESMEDEVKSSADDGQMSADDDDDMEKIVRDDAKSFEIDREMIAIFADFYFLPFEHGTRARLMIDEFRWLKNNADVVVRANNSDLIRYGLNRLKMCQFFQHQEWRHRCDSFRHICQLFATLYRSLIADCSNRSLVADLYPYVWEAHGTMSIVDAVVAWMADGNLLISDSTPVMSDHDETSTNTATINDHEPWIYRGGAIGDFQKLLLPSTIVADMFMLRAPPMIPYHSVRSVSIRPYSADDRTALYDLAHSTFECSELTYDDGGIFSIANVDLFGDCYVAPFIDYASPMHAFVAEETTEDGTKRVIAFSLAALDALQLSRRCQNVHVPAMTIKYSGLDQRMFSDGTQSASGDDVEILSKQLFHFGSFVLADEQVYEKYPSQIEMRCRADFVDTIAMRRLLLVTLSTLAINGSTGVFCLARTSERSKIAMCNRLGLNELPLVLHQSCCLFGRVLL